MALDKDAIEQALVDRWVAQVATPQSLSTQYDNDDTFEPDADAPYARFQVRFAGSFRADWGAVLARHRTIGRVAVSLLYPLGTGTAAVMTMVDIVCNAFVNVQVAGVSLLFETPFPQEPGPDPALARWRQNVICPFFADEFA